MRGTSWLLLGLLGVSNATWAVLALRTREADDAGSADAPEARAGDPTEVAALRARVRELEQELGDGNRGPSLVGRPDAAGSEDAASSAAAEDEGQRRAVLEAQERRERQAADRARAQAAYEEEANARSRVDAWKAQILQVEDPARREAGLVALEGAIRSHESALAAAAMRCLPALYEIDYDKTPFRDAVRARLDDPDAAVRHAAAFAFPRLEPEPADLERLIDVAEAHPDETRLLTAAAWLSKRRIEGRLAALFVQALATDDPQAAKDTANTLRGMWVTEEVEDAALAAFRRTASVADPGLWWHIVGQIAPTREKRVRLIFEVLTRDDHLAPQLLDRALSRSVLDPSAVPLAARLAAEALPNAPNAQIRRFHLRVLAETGGPEEARVVRAYASNPMVGESIRREATKTADRMERRR